ncbi:MAG TPA: RNA polymerase subunit sigma [Planctomycetaceae bacterium]|nr:MAG: RNA polymerase sigma factor [Planctomycetaceae bacterium]HAA63017.1 RNA polymerase subunit sigma [Planctomycetaceae bacterium]|tara:strand:+ start:688 stop:1233 length:546 start_codon:yes stop_codon:yes gene_type:complete
MGTSRDHTPGPSLDLAELVEQYAGLLFGIARRLSGCSTDAEDLVQQTFLAAHAHGNQLRDTTKVRAWLCTILRNEFLKLVRSRRRGSTISLDGLGEPSAPDHAKMEVDGEAILLALDSLPEEFRIPIVLYFFEEMSYREISESLDLPIGTVMSRLSRAKSRLRERLGRLDLEPDHSVAHTG